MTDNLLRAALAQYDFRAPQATLLRHNENETYCVTDGGKKYVLRIHRPAAGFSLGTFGVDSHSKEMLESEMQILEALSESDIPVQRPVRNRSGAHVTLSEDAPVTVLEWLEGPTLDDFEPDESDCLAAGAMAARMHRFFRAHPQLNALPRYRYDHELIDRLSDRLSQGQTEDVQIRIMLDALAAIREHTLKMQEKEGGFGLIHADLSRGNLVRTARGIAPIDFCLCGYGSRHMDLGSLVSNFKPHLTASLLKGYSDESGETVTEKDAAPFLAQQVLLFIAAHLRESAVWDWYPKAMDRWCKTLFLPLING